MHKVLVDFKRTCFQNKHESTPSIPYLANLTFAGGMIFLAQGHEEINKVLADLQGHHFPQCETNRSNGFGGVREDTDRQTYGHRVS